MTRGRRQENQKPAEQAIFGESLLYWPVNL
jgi:hypothetical protein